MSKAWAWATAFSSRTKSKNKIQNSTCVMEGEVNRVDSEQTKC